MKSLDLIDVTKLNESISYKTYIRMEHEEKKENGINFVCFSWMNCWIEVMVPLFIF